MQRILIGRKIKLFFMMHWLKITIGFFLVFLVILAIWGLLSLESFYRKMTLQAV